MDTTKKLGCIKTYELKQETPLIHFQHDQKGATLRATEVKPKLDRFIIKKLGGLENAKSEKKNWFIGDTEALNYKMQITATGTPETSNTIDKAIEIKRLDSIRGKNPKTENQKTLERELKAEINEMYFGNMVGKDGNYEEEVRKHYKETVFYGENTKIELKIICFIQELKDEIFKYIEEFFLVHNFGTRQSKGFGGFSIKTDAKTNPIEMLNSNGYQFFYARIPGGNPEYKEMLNHAKNIYAVLKGGYNLTGWNDINCQYKFPKRYIKGYIQRQFLDDFYGDDFGSDKARIKSKKSLKQNYVYPKNREGQPGEYAYKHYLFVRAMLGLADHYEFKSERTGNVEIFSLGEESYDVERFKSPITIKVVGNYLIFIFGSFDAVCGKIFYFSPNGYPKHLFEGKKYKEIKKIIERDDRFITIETPEKFDEDDIEKLITHFIKYFDSEKKKLGEFNRDIDKSKDVVLLKGGAKK